MAVAKCWIEFW